MPASPASLVETVAALRAGSLPLAAYVTAACDRVEATEPTIHALVPEEGRRARLLAEAAGLMDAYPDPATRPPLFGLLVGVKDIIHAHGFETRAGGALVLGKTHTTEFAGSAPGPTRNPHDPAHTPGGSSSGSAAAVAAGYCPLALGTQTVGSVVRPAAFCGVVGFKPTYGRIPAQGILYYSESVDTIGLFAPDVAGVALAASVVCDGWRPAPAPERLPVLGVPEGPYLAQASAEGLDALARQLAALEAAGYTVRRVPALDDIAEVARLHTRMNRGELARVYAPWFAQHEASYRPQTRANIRAGQGVSDGEIEAGRASRGATRARLHALMDTHGLGLWACPPAPGPAPAGIEGTGDPALNLPWSHAGMPAVSVPAGIAANGLPLGLQLVARAGADESLLAWAAGIVETVRLV